MKRVSGGFYGSGSFSKLLPHHPPNGNPMFLMKYWVSDEVGGASGTASWLTVTNINTLIYNNIKGKQNE